MTADQTVPLVKMKTLYIFIIFIGFIRANSNIAFVSPTGGCLNEPDFCSCARIWVTCDCQSGNKTTGNLLHNKKFIRIRNCQLLTVPRGSFKSGPLTVIFQDIKNLSLAAGSVETDTHVRINITISKSNLSEIPSGMFSVSGPGPQDPPLSVARTTPTLAFHVADSEIGRIAPGVFAKHTLRALTITNTVIGHIDTGAIDNQVQETVSFVNNTFLSLDRRAVALHSSHRNKKLELVLDGNRFKGNVEQFLEGNITGDAHIHNNSFPELKTSPWRLRVEGDITLLGNTFVTLPRHGMYLIVRHRISLVKNDIQHLGPEAFLLIVPEGKKAIIFMDGNLIHQQEPMSLCLNENFSPNSVVIKHVRFQKKCECNITNTLSRGLDIKNLTLEAIYKNDVHEQWFKNGECMLKPQGISYISIDQFLIHSCLKHNNHIMEILLAFALILITITVCVILGWRRMRRTASNTNSSGAGYHSYTEPCPPTTVPGSWLVVQPESRTYQETEIHVVFDKAQEINDVNDAETNKNERDNDKFRDIKRTPSPSTRQSCPVLL